MADPQPLAVYIHWPYCARICPYCDFNVYKRREDTTLLPAILKDLVHWRSLSGERDITSIHFGGGTPSLMTPAQVGAMIEQVDALWGLGDVEIALEANPHEADAESWQGYRAAGLTRMSLGVQTFNNAALKFLGRDHNGAQAREALDLGMSIFPSVSADLIFGWAGQTSEMLADDLEKLLQAGSQHISTYQLTIEDGTAFAKAEGRGQDRAVDADLSADFYDLVRDKLITAGFNHYEVSNFAKPRHQSQHNLAYWRGLDYAGVGPGAHGRMTIDGVKHASVAQMRPAAYVKSVGETGSGIESNEILSGKARAEEYILMGLRIDEGISLRKYKKLSQGNLNEVVIRDFVTDGLLKFEGDRLKATFAGRLVLNAIIERILLG
ncbi:radical SAM family heme chaperone HemW [Litorimonas sp. WD9-15]|uniref:radical SAM family heme chaperone HemW n=1 Tax=Litorimonas sp. WD9-15 TaxID=3418716 RepID=UPI003CFD3565